MKVSKIEKNDIYQKTDFFGIISQARGFTLNFSESALKTDLEKRF
jgi:hypothetical protein